MNTLHKNIKISVLISMIAIGATLAGCASRSSKAAPAASTSSAAAQSDNSAAASSGAASSQALSGSTTTGNANGQPPIEHADLMSLIKSGVMKAQ